MEAGQHRPLATSYLGWSIFSTFCCCLPLGIAAIIYSSKVSNANAVGDTNSAEDASRTAKILNITALVIGLAVIITSIALSLTI
ncbi:proline rich transmembrane protein 1B [Kryptolebias marmoratus]|uniref:Proline rich transmembrane protein 1B-like n=1 Tax=Kryptolebias marmoratus TaxID=37003 RepID=A0A3Q3A9Y5_KRYMA|nr:proline rich transmembrane protein 1B [Kryptolebias marmoratus]